MLSNYDQPIRLTDEDAKVFDDVDMVVGRSITIGDPSVAFEFGSHLRRQQSVQGLALAKLLYRIKQGWDLYRAAGIEDEMESMAQTEMGVSPETTKKYIRMWTSIFENGGVEDGVKQILMGRPIQDLLLLTAAVREGDLTGEELRDAAMAADQKELKEIIRHKRGEHTSSSSSITICLTMRDSQSMAAGTLFAKRGNERVTLGLLYKAESELAKMAISKLINGRPILEVY